MPILYNTRIRGSSIYPSIHLIHPVSFDMISLLVSDANNNHALFKPTICTELESYSRLLTRNRTRGDVSNTKLPRSQRAFIPFRPGYLRVPTYYLGTQLIPCTWSRQSAFESRVFRVVQQRDICIYVENMYICTSSVQNANLHRYCRYNSISFLFLFLFILFIILLFLVVLSLVQTSACIEYSAVVN